MPGRLPRWLWVVGGLLLVGLCVYALRGVLTPICLAFGIAYLLDPLVDRFVARGVPRGAAITLVLAMLASAGGLFLLLVLPGVVREVGDFASDLPRKIDELRLRVEPWLVAHGVPVPHDLDEALRQFEIAPRELAMHAAAPAQAVLRWVLGSTVSAIGAVASALIVPVLAFYVLYDFDALVAGARDLVPPRIRPWVIEVGSEIDQVLGQFVRGQLLVMIAMAILYSVAYTVVGIRLAVPIGLVAGLLAFIPYVGGGLALAMGLLMTIVDWSGWQRPLGIVIAYAICQTLEGFVIVPRVVGDKVGLPAVWVLVALMVGGEVFGFLGVLLAVPAAAVLKIFVVRAVRWYRQSAMYLEGAGVERVAEVVARTGRGCAPDPARASGSGSERLPAPEGELAAPAIAAGPVAELGPDGERGRAGEPVAELGPDGERGRAGEPVAELGPDGERGRAGEPGLDPDAEPVPPPPEERF
jgi:predicted PurR-regulated permease PerM